MSNREYQTYLLVRLGLVPAGYGPRLAYLRTALGTEDLVDYSRWFKAKQPELGFPGISSISLLSIDMISEYLSLQDE